MVDSENPCPTLPAYLMILIRGMVHIVRTVAPFPVDFSLLGIFTFIVQGGQTGAALG
jgi:hypothetical protein